MSSGSRPASGYDAYEDLSLDDEPISPSESSPAASPAKSFKSLSHSPTTSKAQLASPSSISSPHRAVPWRSTKDSFPESSSYDAGRDQTSPPTRDTGSPSQFQTPSTVITSPTELSSPYEDSLDRPGPSFRPSLASYTTGSTPSIKTATARELENVPLVLGVVVVDFNHLVSCEFLCVVQLIVCADRTDGRICVPFHPSDSPL